MQTRCGIRIIPAPPTFFELNEHYIYLAFVNVTSDLNEASIARKKLKLVSFIYTIKANTYYSGNLHKTKNMCFSF